MLGVAAQPDTVRGYAATATPDEDRGRLTRCS